MNKYLLKLAEEQRNLPMYAAGAGALLGAVPAVLSNTRAVNKATDAFMSDVYTAMFNPDVANHPRLQARYEDFLKEERKLFGALADRIQARKGTDNARLEKAEARIDKVRADIDKAKSAMRPDARKLVASRTPISKKGLALGALAGAAGLGGAAYLADKLYFQQ